MDLPHSVLQAQRASSAVWPNKHQLQVMSPTPSCTTWPQTVCIGLRWPGNELDRIIFNLSCDSIRRIHDRGKWLNVACIEKSVTTPNFQTQILFKRRMEPRRQAKRSRSSTSRKVAKPCISRNTCTKNRMAHQCEAEQRLRVEKELHLTHRRNWMLSLWSKTPLLRCVWDERVQNRIRIARVQAWEAMDAQTRIFVQEAVEELRRCENASYISTSRTSCSNVEAIESDLQIHLNCAKIECRSHV